MRVDHIALWTRDLDRCKRFFCRDATEGAACGNAKKGFESCFLTFGDGARIEAMKTTAFVPEICAPGAQRTGPTHLDISVGSERSLMSLPNRSERMATRFLTVRAEPGMATTRVWSWTRTAIELRSPHKKAGF
jgi:lactoylglutathione lyase